MEPSLFTPSLQLESLAAHAWPPPTSLPIDAVNETLAATGGDWLNAHDFPLEAGQYAYRLWMFSSVTLTCRRHGGACSAEDAALRDGCEAGAFAAAVPNAFVLWSGPVQFHHFMLEQAPALAFYLAAVTADEQPSTPILVHPEVDKASFAREMLQLLLPGTAARPVPKGSLCVRGRLLWPQRTAQHFGLVTHPAGQLMRMASTRVRALMMASGGAGDASAAAADVAVVARSRPARKLFLDRMDTRPVHDLKRKLTNGAALAAQLRSRGFLQRSVGDLSFMERARLLQAATVVVMLAGTTQVNQLFLPAGARVFVVAHPLGWKRRWNMPWYGWLCAVSGCTAAFLHDTRVDHSPPVPREPWRVDYAANLPELLAQLDAVVGSLERDPQRWPPAGVGVHCGRRCDPAPEEMPETVRTECEGVRGSARDAVMCRMRTCVLSCGATHGTSAPKANSSQGRIAKPSNVRPKSLAVQAPQSAKSSCRNLPGGCGGVAAQREAARVGLNNRWAV